jgi:hypothetical protein
MSHDPQILSRMTMLEHKLKMRFHIAEHHKVGVAIKKTSNIHDGGQ